ncbi:hypothetical protein [Lactovum odontotermitis]
MKKPLLIGAAALGALTLAAVTAPVSASADTQIPLYRTYNPNSGEHFYTTSYDEALNAYNAGWNIEGVGWQTPSAGSAVYRVFNPNSRNAGSHYYTANKSEADHLVSLGWAWDNNGQPVFYSGGQFPVYVQYNKNNSGHNYTTSLNEQNSVVAAGWEENNITIYAAGEGNQDGAMAHVNISWGAASSAAAHQVDVGESDVLPSGTYRLLYPNNAFPSGDRVSVPAGAPTLVMKGTVSTADASSASGGAKYTISGTSGNLSGAIGIGFQNIPAAATHDFGGGQISMLIMNFMGNAASAGQQYYVTVSDGVNQTGTNAIEVDYYAKEKVAVYKLNGKAIAALKTQINYSGFYSFQTAGASASDTFTATSPTASQSWTGNTGGVNLSE